MVECNDGQNLPEIIATTSDPEYEIFVARERLYINDCAVSILGSFSTLKWVENRIGFQTMAEVLLRHEIGPTMSAFKFTTRITTAKVCVVVGNATATVGERRQT